MVIEVLELDLNNGAPENMSRKQEFEESNRLQVKMQSGQLLGQRFGPIVSSIARDLKH